ncbi:NUMOD3 motif (2 copies) [compost metagenome]
MIGAYIIRHPATGIFYIGSTANYNQRQWDHLSGLRRGQHRNPTLQKAYIASPEITWEFIPTNTEEEARELERQMLQANYGHVSMANYIGARPLTTEHREAISQGLIGKPLSQEHREAMTQSWNIERREALSARSTARIVSDNTKQLISDSWTEERRKEHGAKISASQVGRTHSEESRQRISETRKKTKVIINGVTFDSLAAAAQAHDVTASTVMYRVKNPKVGDWLLG